MKLDTNVTNVNVILNEAQILNKYLAQSAVAGFTRPTFYLVFEFF